jgi:hypothetical protein
MPTHGEQCFYCGDTVWVTGGLEEHHLWRGKDRLLSPSVYLCPLKCHRRATNNVYFAEKLKKIYLHQYGTNKIKPGTVASYGTDKFYPGNYGRNEQHALGRGNARPSQGLDEQIKQLPVAPGGN